MTLFGTSASIISHSRALYAAHLATLVVSLAYAINDVCAACSLALLVQLQQDCYFASFGICKTARVRNVAASYSCRLTIVYLHLCT